MPTPTAARLAEFHVLAAHPGTFVDCRECATAEQLRLDANRNGRRHRRRTRAAVDRLLGGDAA